MSLHFSLQESSFSWQDITVTTRPSRGQKSSKKLLDGVSGHVEGGMLQLLPHENQNDFGLCFAADSPKGS
jgi:hypothetical protein